MNNNHKDDIEPAIDKKTIDDLIIILKQLKIGTSGSIDLQKLRQTEDELENILVTLQIDFGQAEADSNWESVNKLRPAIQECLDTIDSIQAAIINQFVIGVDSENMQQMQKILADIEESRKTQVQINFVISLFGSLRRLLSANIL